MTPARLEREDFPPIADEDVDVGGDREDPLEEVVGGVVRVEVEDRDDDVDRVNGEVMEGVAEREVGVARVEVGTIDPGLVGVGAVAVALGPPDDSGGEVGPP